MVLKALREGKDNVFGLDLVIYLKGTESVFMLMITLKKLPIDKDLFANSVTESAECEATLQWHEPVNYPVRRKRLVLIKKSLRKYLRS